MRTRHVSGAGLAALFIATAVPAAAQEELASPARRPVTTGVPEYPRKARDKRLEGKVVVCYVIDARGRVRSPYVEQSSNRIFNKAALRAIRETRYAEAAPGATNAKTSSCNTYRFILTPQSESAAGESPSARNSLTQD